MFQIVIYNNNKKNIDDDATLEYVYIESETFHAKWDVVDGKWVRIYFENNT